MQSMHTYRAWTNKEGRALGRTQQGLRCRIQPGVWEAIGMIGLYQLTGVRQQYDADSQE